MDLQEIRGSINEVDQKILEHLLERFKLTQLVAEIKRETGKHVRDRTREYEHLRELQNKAQELGIPEDYVLTVFRTIIEGSVTIQNQLLKRPTGSVQIYHCPSPSCNFNTSGEPADTGFYRCVVCGQTLTLPAITSKG